MEGKCEQKHRRAEGEGQLGVGEGIRVAAMPDAGEELSRKSPSGRGPLLLSGASSGAGSSLHPQPCPGRALLPGQRGSQGSGVKRRLPQPLS